MTTIDDVRQLQRQGKTQGEISMLLKQRGISDQEASVALSQAQIQDAVSAPNASGEPTMLTQPSMNDPVMGQDSALPRSQSSYAGMQQSSFMGAPPAQPEQPAQQSQQYSQAPATSQYESSQVQPQYDPSQGQYDPSQQYQNYGQQYAQPGYDQNQQQGSQDQYSQYQPYQGALSSDMISEIAEQITSEKLTSVRDRLEKVSDFRTIAETRLEDLDKRMKRIELIIDRLQLSVLQKVGEYVNDVQDIKKEMRESQKSFKALLPELRASKPSPPPQAQNIQKDQRQ